MHTSFQGAILAELVDFQGIFASHTRLRKIADIAVSDAEAIIDMRDLFFIVVVATEA
jgi:hypothetical protein